MTFPITPAAAAERFTGRPCGPVPLRCASTETVRNAGTLSPTVALSVGPVVGAGLIRAGNVAGNVVVRRRWERETLVPALLFLAAGLAVLAADLSGPSKAETERIWLPFGVWLVASLALLPRRFVSVALTTQVAVALLVNHLVVTNW